jgi:hypothetical protein
VRREGYDIIMSIPKSPPALRSRKIIPEVSLKLIWSEDGERNTTAQSHKKIQKNEHTNESHEKVLNLSI